MRLKTAAAFACVLFASAAGAKAADVDDATQKAIAANYALVCTAAFDPSDANLSAAFAILAPDFVNVDVKGSQQTRDQIVGRGTQQMKMVHATACDDKFESIVASDPNTVLVTNVLHMEGDLQIPDGKHNFLLTSKALDTWKNVDGKWLQSQSKDLRILVKIDGSVVQDQGS
jgi:ketosteroid isomerase-like protein